MNMPLFSFILPIGTIVLLACALCALCAATLMSLPMRRVRRSPDPLPPAPDAHRPSVSVIALASNDTDLAPFIESVTTQQYPHYEVIIVHESTSQANDALTDEFPFTPKTNEEDNPVGCRDLRFCFYPPGSHALSCKKLALTIGMKSATGDVVVTTDASCRIDSPLWLEAMMRHFSPGTDVTLGFAAVDFDKLPRSYRPLARQTHLLTQTQWITAALNGNPYRGDGLNLAFRRNLFFDQKGYAGSIDLMNGEDDIFVNAITHGDNTAVELSDASVVHPDRGEEARRIFTDARERYRFTRSRLPSKPFMVAATQSWLQWSGIALAVAAAVVALPNLFGSVIALLLIILAFAIQALTYRPAARALGDNRGAWMFGPLLLARPIDNACFSLRHRARRKANYTYRR